LREGLLADPLHVDHYNSSRSHHRDGLALRAPTDTPNIIPFPTTTGRISAARSSAA
jgi:hypothetical protein